MRCALALISHYEPSLQHAFNLTYETLQDLQANRPDPLPINQSRTPRTPPPLPRRPLPAAW